MSFTPEQLAQLESIVERVVKKALEEEPVLRQLGDGHGLARIELRHNQILAELRELRRELRELSPPVPGR